MEKFKEFLEMMKFWNKSVEEAAKSAPAGTAGKGGEEKSFTEEDIEQAKKEAAEKAKEEAKAEAAKEFAEKEKAKTAEARKTEIAAWVDERVKDKKLPPAFKEAGIAAFMEGLDSENEIAFSEAEGAEKKTALAWFQAFLDGLPQARIFEEMAKKGKAKDQKFTEAEAEWEAGKRAAQKVSPPPKEK